MDHKLRINDVAKSTGLSKQAIRYYEDHGLLNHVFRDRHNNRVYTRDQINRLIFIKKSKELDFSLTEILAIFKTYDKGISPYDRVADIISKWITDLHGTSYIKSQSCRNLKKSAELFTTGTMLINTSAPGSRRDSTVCHEK